jgi:ferric-dicitrate binding protein FerR (iron transport regulator)
MSNERDPRSNDREAAAERALEQLFAHTEPRPAPPAADTEEIRRALYAEWDALTSRRVWYRRAGVAAAASLALAAVFWAAIGTNPGAPVPMIARVERVQGIVTDGGRDRLAVDASLGAGSVVATASGQVALRLASGGSLRLGPQSRLELTAADGVELLAGVLYFDSEDQRPGGELTVVTEHGVVRDVGTQFLARVDGGALEVGVRDGRVAVVRGDERGDASAGERLVVAEGAPGIRRDTIATFGDEWAWVERLAPPFDIDGRTLSDFLDWFEQQTGRTVVFADPSIERIARDAILKGSIDREPLPKLSAVLTMTNLGYSLDGERVVIAAP